MMGSVIGSVTDAIGLTDHSGQEAAQNAANQQAQFSNNLTTEQLAFQKQQYEDWKAIYGDIQENLGDYYKNLSAADYEARGVTAVNQEYAKANTQLQQTLAQRGITSSGIAAAAATSLSQQLASAKTEARITAPEKVAQQKMNFLGLGLGQGTQMLGIEAGVSNNGASNSAGIATNALSNSTSLSNSNTNTVGTLVGMGIKALASDVRLKENIQEVYTLADITFYTWTWNKLGESLGYIGQGFGVIAQEVDKVIPDSVCHDDEYLTVNYATVLSYIGEKDELS